MFTEQFHYLTNYGHCRLDDCQCISQTKPRFDGAWGGLACPDWIPLGPTNMQELIDVAKATYKKDQKNDGR